ncbi:hypothetical protein MHI18_20740 [Peribacillus sp. FSL H8-0477]|uniref:hypothetical protein n=1 Tax=Peribacillus sp. FSL H8-0477 TaxID=2921388 RepID=UPI0030F6B8CE
MNVVNSSRVYPHIIKKGQAAAPVLSLLFLDVGMNRDNLLQYIGLCQKGQNTSL